MPNNEAEALVVVKNDIGKLEVQSLVCKHWATRNGSWRFCSWHCNRKWGDNLCPLSTVDGKTSVEHQLRCLRRKFTSPIFWGTPKGASDETDKQVRLQEKNWRSVSVHFFFFTWIRCLILSSWGSSHVPILPFFLPETACYLEVNKPWYMFNRNLRLSTCYDGEVTTDVLLLYNRRGAESH